MAKYPNRIQVNLSNKLRDRVYSEAEDFGISVPEYVRYVILKNLDREEEYLLRDVKKAEKDLERGDVVRTKSKKEAVDVLRNL
ncbi:MAG: hypothetical protein RBS29_09380 [Bacteroidales bacterium]|jgi:hypothetical protein|nr:hypothetical protein [Bacteroidales bacterium]